MNNTIGINGLDTDGYIVNEYSIDNIQPEFVTVVDTVIEQLTTLFDNRIHSIYLYGSIPRGNAKIYTSDLDVSIIFQHKLSDEDIEVMNKNFKNITCQHPEISKLDLDPICIDEVLQTTEHYRWQFWLKCCCCCIWGEDLTVTFDKYRPNIAIACALNDDLANFINDIEKNFLHLSSHAIGKIIGKKLLRTAYYLIATEDGSWHTDLTKCTEIALKYYPEYQADIQQAFELAQGIDANQEKGKRLFGSLGTLLLEKLALA